MNSIDWIKDLVLTEQQMEEEGVIDLSQQTPDTLLREESLTFLRQIKTAMIEAAAAFNQLKATNTGTVKIYGISNTEADFMLFRNGFKLIFSLRQPGEIEVFYSLIGSHFLAPQAEAENIPSGQEKELLRARWGAFGELSWSHRELPVKLDYLVRYYFSRFIRESTK